MPVSLSPNGPARQSASFGWQKEETLGKRIDNLNMIYDEDISIVNRTIVRLTSGKELMVVSSNRNFTKSGAVINARGIIPSY